jgi:hypothetical protein
MTSEQIQSIRDYMKEFRAQPTSDEFIAQAEVVNQLIPSIVDEITDAEIEGMIHQTFSYILSSIINQKESNDQTQTTSPIEPTEDIPVTSGGS